MSDEQDFLLLPSIVRQAMERSAGFNGNEGLRRQENPLSVVMVTASDWTLIRDYMVQLQAMTLNNTSRWPQRMDWAVD